MFGIGKSRVVKATPHGAHRALSGWTTYPNAVDMIASWMPETWPTDRLMIETRTLTGSRYVVTTPGTRKGTRFDLPTPVRYV